VAELLIPQSVKDNLPTAITSSLGQMTSEQQSSFMEEFKRRSKSTGLAYVLWILFGFHYAYLGKWGTQILYWLTGAGFVIWGLIDLFRIPSIVANKNKDVAMDVLRDIKIVSSPNQM
jgi:TM2 domain-containing membrane protein YozV